MVEVELVYIPEQELSVHLSLSVPTDTEVAEIVRQSGILQRYPHLVDAPIGIFSQRVSADYIVQNGDRIEIYRPLRFDPKDKRRERASIAKRKNNSR